jgi:predicted phage terminase large subunit-like protein
MLQEMRSRGVSLEKKVLEKAPQLEKKITWPVAPNGFFIRDDGHLYEPTVEQRAFIDSNARFVLFRGGRGSGKSGAGAQKALRRIMQGESGAVINPVFADFKTSTWPEFKRWIPWNMVVPQQRHRRREEWEPHQPFVMVFTNGAKVYCKGLNNPRGARGANINWLWYDEAASDPTGMAWNIAVAAVRIGREPQCWATTTPKGTEHWVYKFFINRDIPQEVIDVLANSVGGDRILIENFHGSIDENKANLDPAFYASILMAYPSGWLRQQEAEGEFANEGGKIGDRFWFNDKVLDSAPDTISKRVRFWDLAGTEKKRAKDDPDETVGALVSKFKLEDKDAPQFCIEHMVTGYWEEEKVLSAILNTARFDGPTIPVYIEQEPASSGKNWIAVIKQEFKKYPELQAHRVEGIPAKDVGDRVLAASTYWFGQAAAGNMWIVRAEWNDKFLGQLDGFTQIEHDDRVTAVTGAMYKLNPYRIWKRVPFLAI